MNEWKKVWTEREREGRTGGWRDAGKMNGRLDRPPASIPTPVKSVQRSSASVWN